VAKISGFGRPDLLAALSEAMCLVVYHGEPVQMMCVGSLCCFSSAFCLPPNQEKKSPEKKTQ
jgi:hypothetical protein